MHDPKVRLFEEGRANPALFGWSLSRDAGPNSSCLGGRFIDVDIRIYLVTSDGRHESVPIETYNPFFGCDVRFFEWIESRAVLIYREKHDTYVYSFGDLWPPRFVEIERRWQIVGTQLGYRGYRASQVQRLALPGLDWLATLSLSNARLQGFVFPD
jgi:hypothetical protein